MSTQITLDYTNWRGERKEYTVVPDKIWYGNSQYHKGEQWFLRANVYANGLPQFQVRDFAMVDIHSMKAA